MLSSCFSCFHLGMQRPTHPISVQLRPLMPFQGECKACTRPADIGSNKQRKHKAPQCMSTESNVLRLKDIADQRETHICIRLCFASRCVDCRTLSGGLVRKPPLKRRVVLTSGTSWSSTRKTRNPLLSNACTCTMQ